MNVFRPGVCEPAKAAVHGTIEALAILCCGYSIGAMIVRRKLSRHLLINAVMYGVLVAVEHQHVRHHCVQTHEPPAVLPSR